jgi:hypothetical protein
MATDPTKSLLSEIGRLRRRTRADLQGIWFPLVLFGALSMASALVALRFGGVPLGLFWVVAAPAGSAVTAVYYRRRARRIGLEAPATPYVITAAVLVLGAFLTGGLGGALGVATVSALGPPLCVSAGYLLFARLAHSWGLAAVAIALSALTVAIGIAKMPADQATWSLAMVYGAVFVGTGLFFRASVTGRA